MKKVDIISKVVARKGEAMASPSKGAAPSVDLSGYLLKEIWDRIFEIRSTENGEEYIFCKTSLAAQGGLIMYVDGGLLNLPSIYDGLPIDGKTLFWEEVIADDGTKSKILKSKGGGGGSIEYSLSWSGYGGGGSWDGSEEKSFYIPSKVSELANDSKFLTQSALNSSLSDYLPLTGGTLTGNLTVNGTFNAKGTRVYLPTGNDGRGFAFAGKYMQVHWDYSSTETILHLDGNNCPIFSKTPQVTGSGYLADRAWVGNNYLSLSGGKVSGTLYVNTLRSYSTFNGGNFWILGISSGNLSVGGNHAGYYTSMTGETVKLYGGATEKIRITSSEIKVFQSAWVDDGIKLIRTSGSNAGAGISVYGIDTYKGCFGISGSEVFEFHSNTSGLCFSVDKGGNGIFKANTGFGLTIDRTSSNGGAYTRYRPNNQTNQSWTVGASNGYYFSVYYQNVDSGIDAKKMTLDTAGNLLVIGGVTMYGTSDQRLKQNIRKFSASEELVKLGGVYQFEYIEEEVKRNKKYKGTHFGLIYQNVKESSLSKMCMEREDGFGALNYLDTSFISLLAAVGMEHETRLQRLERENRELRMEVEQLKNK